MIPPEPHHCKSCKGTGKLLAQGTRAVRGAKRTVRFLVDCPGKLAEQVLPDERSGTTGIGGLR